MKQYRTALFFGTEQEEPNVAARDQVYQAFLDAYATNSDWEVIDQDPDTHWSQAAANQAGFGDSFSPNTMPAGIPGFYMLAQYNADETVMNGDRPAYAYMSDLLYDAEANQATGGYVIQELDV